MLFYEMDVNINIFTNKILRLNYDCAQIDANKNHNLKASILIWIGIESNLSRISERVYISILLNIPK